MGKQRFTGLRKGRGGLEVELSRVTQHKLELRWMTCPLLARCRPGRGGRAVGAGQDRHRLGLLTGHLTHHHRYSTVGFLGQVCCKYVQYWCEAVYCSLSSYLVIDCFSTLSNYSSAKDYCATLHW